LLELQGIHPFVEYIDLIIENGLNPEDDIKILGLPLYEVNDLDEIENFKRNLVPRKNTEAKSRISGEPNSLPKSDLKADRPETGGTE
jgi:hypothetical protein